jgi:hypothetical protein
MLSIARGQSRTSSYGKARDQGVAHIHRVAQCFALRRKLSIMVDGVGGDVALFRVEVVYTLGVK